MTILILKKSNNQWIDGKHNGYKTIQTNNKTIGFRKRVKIVLQYETRNKWFAWYQYPEPNGTEYSEQDLENEQIVEERIYTIPLSKAWSTSKRRRTPRAMRVLKDFIRKHMKPEELVITTEVNEFLWSKGIEGSPRRIRIKAVRDTDNVVTVYLVKGE